MLGILTCDDMAQHHMADSVSALNDSSAGSAGSKACGNVFPSQDGLVK